MYYQIYMIRRKIFMNNSSAKDNKQFNPNASLDISNAIIIQARLLRAFGKYLSENYLMGEDFNNKIPYKIFEYTFNKGKINVTDYSPDFIRMFYDKTNPSTNFAKINKAIEDLKNNNYKLYQSLIIVWDKDYNQQNCHLTTVYRRYNKALFILASELGLLTDDIQELYKQIAEKE